MKIQLDTTKKTIKIEENVNLRELIETLEALLPNEGWKEFKLETHTEIKWTQNPIAIERNPYEPIPWRKPWITYKFNDKNIVIPDKYELTSGVYNFEVTDNNNII